VTIAVTHAVEINTILDDLANFQWNSLVTRKPPDERVDLWAKHWNEHNDTFEYQRFADCRWMPGDPMGNRQPYWLGLGEGWYPTHWRLTPKGPDQK
jgi:hypothetical protein